MKSDIIPRPKPYQHHDEYHDIGKAVPHAKAPNSQKMVSRFFKSEPNPNTIHPYEAPKTRMQKVAQNRLWKKQERQLQQSIQAKLN